VRYTVGQATIDILPEDVLLKIFDCYLAEAGMVEEWQKLVHVCQKWRYAVFRSPLRLDLRILCTRRIPVSKKLAAWPPLPIVIKQSPSLTSKWGEGDDIFAALGHSDRICEIALTLPSSQLEIVIAAMQKTFVVLKWLQLRAVDRKAPAISDSFLGGSALHLRHLRLIHIPLPFPVIRKLFLSAPNLVTLILRDIPHSGYISPEEMVTCLSALTRLEILAIIFQSSQSRPPREGRHLPPTRSVFPALTKLTFNGASEYLEDLVTWIGAPLLDYFFIIFFHELIFDTPQLFQFISRTPKLKACDQARVIFTDSRVVITLPGRDNLGFVLGITCRQPGSGWQLSSLAQICRSSFPQALFPMLERLYLFEYEYLKPTWQDDLEDSQWLDLLHPFTTVKNLYLSQVFVPHIVQTLQAPVEERVTEVLPNLQSVFLEDREGLGFVPEAMQQFIAARQLSSRSIAISHWERQGDHERLTIDNYHV